MKNTYCPRLWNEFFINSNGNVYSCCHHKPAKLGNIYNEKLSTIYNNEIIKKLREKSLSGKLSCFKNCNLLSEKEVTEYIFSDLKIETDDLRRLKIVFGEGCNINCKMCWQNSKSKKMLSYEVLANNIELKDFKMVDLQGGEPLYIKSSLKYFLFASQYNTNISILTNGTLMSEKIAESLMKASRSIKISLNAGTKEVHESINRGSNWQKVLHNIQFLKEYKLKHNPSFQIIGHMTIIIENLNDIVNFVKYSKRIGFDEIEFGYDFRVPIWLKINKKKKNSLKKEIGLIISKFENEIPIRKYRLTKLGLLE